MFAFRDVRRLSVVISLCVALTVFLPDAFAWNWVAPRVFSSYWAAGIAQTSGQDPFGVLAHTWIFRLNGLTIVDRNLNPPTLLPLFQLFALMPMRVAATAWLAASILLFYVPTLLLIRRYRPHPGVCAWLLLSPLIADTLSLGQIYMLLFALGASAWLLLDARKQLAAGICIGALCAIKPNFGVWPLFLLISGQRRAAASAAVTAAGLIALAALLYGADSYRLWLTAIAHDNHDLIPSDASLNGALMRFGVFGGQLFAGLLLIAGCFWAWRRRDTSGAALAISILASPLAWAHYALLLFPAFVSRRWDSPLIIAAALLSISPETIASTANTEAAPFAGLVYPIAGSLALYSLAKGPRMLERPRAQQALATN